MENLSQLSSTERYGILEPNISLRAHLKEPMIQVAKLLGPRVEADNNRKPKKTKAPKKPKVEGSKPKPAEEKIESMNDIEKHYSGRSCPIVALLPF
jgi:short-subunit dehydrogenase involved in D-alanine esterification of teichoic acids